MHILADGRTFETLRLSDLSPEAQREVASVLCELLHLVGRILARRERERAESES